MLVSRASCARLVLLAMTLGALSLGVGSHRASADPPVPTAGWNTLQTGIDTTVGVGVGYGYGYILGRQAGALKRWNVNSGWENLPPVPDNQAVRQIVSAFDHFVVADRGIYQFTGTAWERISGPVSRIVAWRTTARPATPGGRQYVVLYAEDAARRTLLRYDGTPDRWTAVGPAGAMYAETDSKFYRLAADRQSIWEYGGQPNQWTRIGGAAHSIWAGSRQLAMIGSGGAISSYTHLGWLQDAAVAGETFRTEPGGKLVFAESGMMYYLTAGRDAVWAKPTLSGTFGIVPTTVYRWVPLVTRVRLADIAIGANLGAQRRELVTLQSDGTLKLYGWPNPSVISRHLPHATVGRSYQTWLTGTGGTGPYRWYRYTDSLPPGIVMDVDGQLRGTPTTAGTWALNVILADATGWVMYAPIWIQVDPAPTPPVRPPTQPPVTPAGYSGIGWYNCLISGGELHIWVNDVTTGSGFVEEAGSPLAPPLACPPPGKAPHITRLEDGHIYEVVAVDPAACGANNPLLLMCRRQYIQLRGARNGPQWPTQYVP